MVKIYKTSKMGDFKFTEFISTMASLRFSSVYNNTVYELTSAISVIENVTIHDIWHARDPNDVT